MNLYMDIGNTNIKIKWKDEIYFYLTNTEYTSNSFFKALAKKLKEAKPNKVWVSCVVPSLMPVIEEVTKLFWNSELKTISYPLKTKIKIEAYDPKSVGSDIVALASYATTLGDNVIIVNMGTATTLTHVKNNTIQGVVIAPGIKTSFEALIAKASKLHGISLLVPKNKTIGHNTQEAISIGIVKGNMHLINGLAKEIDSEAILILSGGNSNMISEFAIDFKHVQEATLLGIEEIAKLHK